MIESGVGMDNIAEDNCKKLHRSEYPGRAIIMGLSPSGNEFIQLYWTMGRSESSKNRILLKQDGFVRTIPKKDTVEIVKKDLVIYNLACQVGNNYIVTNGVQTNTIVKYITEGKSFEEALSKWKHEDDPPIFTPRISGVVEIQPDDQQYVFKLGINKPLDETGKDSYYNVFTYNNCLKGYAFCIHTYQLDKLCSPFTGEPFVVKTFNSIDEMTAFYWNLIPADKKVGMYVKYINLRDGSIKEKIINRDDMI